MFEIRTESLPSIRALETGPYDLFHSAHTSPNGTDWVTGRNPER